MRNVAVTPEEEERRIFVPDERAREQNPNVYKKNGKTTGEER